MSEKRQELDLTLERLEGMPPEKLRELLNTPFIGAEVLALAAGSESLTLKVMSVLDSEYLRLPHDERDEVDSVADRLELIYKKAQDQADVGNIAPSGDTVRQQGITAEEGSASGAGHPAKHPSPLALAFYKTEAIAHGEQPIVEYHLLQGCDVCKKLVEQDWMAKLRALISEGRASFDRVRKWFANKATFQVGADLSIAYASHGVRKKPFAEQHEAGEFIVHLERTDGNELYVYVWTSLLKYANTHVRVLIMGERVSLNETIHLSRVDDVTEGGVRFNGFDDLAAELGNTDIYVLPAQPDADYVEG